MPPVFQRRDAELQLPRALPSAASTTVTGKPIDLQNSKNGNFLAEVGYEVQAPAVTTTMVPDTRTVTYQLVHGAALDANGDIDSPVALMTLGLQTGAGGAGAAAAKFSGRFPVDVKRYVALRIVSGASVTDSSTVSALLSLTF